MINFGLMYGMGAFGLARQLGIDAARRRITSRCTSALSGRARFMERTRQQAREPGLRRNRVQRRAGADHPLRNAAQRAGAERAAINAPMQGTAGHYQARRWCDIDGWLAGRGEALR